jgi:FG-GAP-like repeat
MMRILARFICGFLLLLSSFAASAQGQNLFFQTPTYAGSGNVFAEDFNGDGKTDLLSADGTLEFGNGDGTFRLGTPVSGTPLAVGDFNGDGKPDVLEQGTGTLLVLLGNGDGTFKSAILTPSGAILEVVAAPDLNGDGKADVVGVFNNQLYVYLSHGDGTFAPPVTYSTGATSVGATVLSLGDFNGDHKTDVVLSIAGNNVAGQEIVFLGNGDGTFQAAKQSAGIFYPAYAAVGDFNGDGKLDLAISSSCTTGCPAPTTYILLGNGSGSFGGPSLAFPGNGPLAAIDLNGDGKLDLFLENQSVGQVYLGNGDGTFSNAGNYFLYGSSLSQMATGDFNSDGKLDIAVSPNVLLGNGNGTFQGVPFGSIPDTAVAAITGNFDKTGSPGVAILSNQQIGSTYLYNVYILSNDGKGALSLAHTYPLPGPGYGIVGADFNGDTNLDLMVFSTDPITQKWSYNVLLGNGDGTFRAPSFNPQNAFAPTQYSIVVGDFNGDHKPDVAVTSSNDTLAFLAGNGDGTFAAPAYIFDANATYLTSGDFNGDGKLDIAAAGNSGTTAVTALLYGNGDGTFQAAILPPSLNGFAARFSADVNNDGKPDFIAFNQVALAKGDGTFTVLPAIGLYAINGVSDLNSDGKTDLLVTYYGGSSHPQQTGVLPGNGDGSFGSLINVPARGVLPFSGLVADMNGDGRPDLLFVWGADITSFGSPVNGVGVVLNVSAPSFGFSATALSPASVPAGNSATSTVTVNRMPGFTGTVALLCLGLPSGVTCQFAPSSVPSGSSSSALTITTTSAAISGTYPIQVQGSAGTLTNIATVSLTVTAPAQTPDFSLSAGSTTTVTVSPGATATYMLSVTPHAGFNQTVALTCSGAPAQSTCAVSPSMVSLNGTAPVTATVTITTRASSMLTPPIRIDGTRPRNYWLPLLQLLALAVMIMLFVRRQKLAMRWVPAFSLAVVIGITMAMAACGGGSSPAKPSGGATATAAGTYTITVTAATSGSGSAAVTHTQTFTLVVQ